MSSISYIKRAIKKFVKDNSMMSVEIYSNWYVGITNKPSRRVREHGSPNVAWSWKADSVDIAREVEKYFIDQGMRGGTGGGTNTKYIYVYKKSGPYT